MLSRDPQEINQRNWYYEELKGIDIIHEVYSGNTYLETTHIKIPWKMLRASLKRRDKSQ